MTLHPLTIGEPEIVLDLEAIIRDLDAGFNTLPEVALRTCQTKREQVTPRLIEVLEEAVRLGREGIVREGNAPFFALFLLTEFCAKESLPVLLELFALRDSTLEAYVGGAKTELFPRTLASLADDQPDVIESLISNSELDDFVRWSAAAAFCYLVRDGRMSRADALDRLTRQLRHAIDSDDYWWATILVCELGNLNPLEVVELIQEAFEQNVIDESIIDWSCFEEYLLLPAQPEACPPLANLKQPIVNTVDELKHWYCFSDEYREVQRRSTLLSDEHRKKELRTEFEQIPSSDSSNEPEDVTVRHDRLRVGRNDPCPCGSGKKFKTCCLRS
jgi:hypothetical protein